MVGANISGPHRKKHLLDLCVSRTKLSVKLVEKMKVKKILFKKIYPYFYVLPAVVFICLFILYPIVKGIYISILDYDPISGTGPYVGMKHFARIWEDRIFWTALRNNLIYIGVTLFTEVAAGLVLAVLVNRVKKIKISVGYRVIIFSPTVISMAAVGILFAVVLHTQVGLLNSLLKMVGLSSWTRSWLGHSNTALLSIIGISCWRFIGFCTILYYAALQRIPESFYEAASIDGATSGQQFLHITIPLLSSVTTVIAGLALIGGFTQFVLPYVITFGGPSHSTEFLATWSIKKAFAMQAMSYGTAISVVLTGIILATTIVYLKWREKETYEY